MPPTTLDELFVDFGYRVDTSSLDKADNRLTKTLQNVGVMARRVTAIMAGSLVALGGLSIGISANFEDELNKSVAIAVGVDAQMKERLAQTARQVAKATTFSAEEAAEAYFFLFSAGMSAEQAIAALPRVAQFAQAGNFSLAQATDLLTDAQSALGLTVDDTTQNMANQSRLADVLVKANTLANATVEQFSTSLTRQFGGALKAYNKDVTEGVAVLAAYADQGVKGSEAGTRLTAVTLDLVAVARKNESAFKKHNVQIFDSQGNLRNYADILASFEQALGGVSSKQQTVILGELGIQKEAQATLLQLLGSSDAIRGYETELQNAAGTTDQIADNQLDSLKSQLSLLKSVVTDVAIRFGSKLLPPLKQLVVSIRENEDKIVPFLAVLGLVGAAVFALAGMFTFLSMSSMILTGALAFLQIVMAPLTLKLLLIVGAVILVIAIVAALAAGIFLLVKNWDQVVEWLRESWTRFTAWFGQQMGRFKVWLIAQWVRLTAWIGERFDALGAGIRETWDTVTGWIGDRFEGLGTTLRGAWDTAAGWIGDRFDALGAGIRETWDVAIGFVEDRLDDLKNAPFLGGLLQGAGAFVSGVGSLFGFGGGGGLPDEATTALLGFAGGPQPPPAGAFVGGARTNNQNVTLQEGAIRVVAAPGQDPAAVGRAVVSTFGNEMDSLAHDADSDILI